MPKREFVMLAKVYDPRKDFVGGWFLSEKLDGIRCFWDGGVTRGLRTAEVPWANTAKDARLVKEPIATGLWTRYGKVINAPDFWLDRLPKGIALDGELTLGRGTFQSLSSVVRTFTEQKVEWADVMYKVFDSPAPSAIFADGSLNGTFYRKSFSGINKWAHDRGLLDQFFERPFYHVHARLKDLVPGGWVHEQVILPSTMKGSAEKIQEELARIETLGGEGLMLRNGISFWKPERCPALLKVKTLHDAEGVVMGYKWAEGTDSEKSLTGEKTDKLLGLMGSLRVYFGGKTFDLSGFTDAERRMVSTHMTPEEAFKIGMSSPGAVVQKDIYNPTFPRGSTVTFKYRERTVDGIPKEARFLRKREII